MKIPNRFRYLFRISAIGALLCISHPANTIRRLAKKTCHPTCRLTEHSLPEYVQDPRLKYGTNPGVIFLLGATYTGTTAAHYLLGTSNNVSILGKENKMSPHKEGWKKTGLKTQPSWKRWDGVLGWVNWDKLVKEYGDLWDTSKPLLIENSPPEIQAPDQLMKHFTPVYGKVRFILLVRGECGYHGLHNYGRNSRPRSELYKNVLDKYPEDTFVIRYEDLCLRWEKVFADLVRWEPLLADIDINSIPGESPEVVVGNRLRTSKGRRGLTHHDHADVSLKQYCDSKLEGWAEGLECETCRGQMDFLKEWGYGDTVGKESCPM